MNDYRIVEIMDTLEKILKRGNSAEVKKEHDKIVIVEIDRHVRLKSTITYKN